MPVSARDLKFDVPVRIADVPHLETVRGEAEHRAVVAALEHADGRAGKAATLLGVSRATMYRLLTRYNLTVEETGSNQPLPHVASTCDVGSVAGQPVDRD